jgi:hypothetical protein
MEKPKHKFQSTKDLLLSQDFLVRRKKAAKYVTREYQDYGYRLAVTLTIWSTKLYISKLPRKKNDQ